MKSWILAFVTFALVACGSTPAQIAAPTDAPSPVVMIVPTEAPEPTAAPSATETPVATPVAMPLAPTDAPVAAESGGLGLTRQQWEAQHGAGTPDPAMGFAYDGGYIVAYQADPAGVETVWDIEQRFGGGGLSIEEARAASTRLLPADRALTKTYTPTEGRLVDLYRSEWLKGRFPESMKIKDFELSMWPEGEPGDFIVLYRAATGKVESIVIGIGNNP